MLKFSSSYSDKVEKEKLEKVHSRPIRRQSYIIKFDYTGLKVLDRELLQFISNYSIVMV